MASTSSPPRRRNNEPPQTKTGDTAEAKWKTSPSTETTGAEGENAKIDRRRKIAENTPPANSNARRPTRRARPRSK